MSKKRPRRRTIVTLAIAAALVAYATVPRNADLTAFDPGEAARLETLMWRHYYDKRFYALFADLYALARDQDGFSPLDSIRIAVAAARAARAFQPTTSRAEAQVAVPPLIDYFAALSSARPRRSIRWRRRAPSATGGRRVARRSARKPTASPSRG